MDVDSDNYRELTAYELSELVKRFRAAMFAILATRNYGGRNYDNVFTGTMINTN